MKCACGRGIDSGAVEMALARGVSLRCSLCSRVIPYPNIVRATAKPLARRSHPVTSAMGAAHAASGLRLAQERALTFVARYPGRTGRELASLSGDVDTRTIGRRLPELVERGLLERGDSRKCSMTGRMATTWYPVGGTQ